MTRPTGPTTMPPETTDITSATLGFEPSAATTFTPPTDPTTAGARGEVDLTPLYNQPLRTMARELDPSLFGRPADGGGGPSTAMTAPVAPHARDWEENWSLPMGPTSSDLITFRDGERDKEIKVLKARLREMEAKVADLETKLSDQTRAANLRVERVSQRVIQLEANQQQRFDEFGEKMAQTMGKVHERRLTEGKIEEMVDRHNNLVRNFETRLAQLSRALSEREIQLMNLAAVNEEARRELARLKRS